MNWKKATLFFIIAAAVIILAYDTLAMTYGGSDASISWVVLTYSKSYPIIPFSFGILMGHFFASQHGA